MQNTQIPLKKVIIIGGGFGGLRAAKTLANNPFVSITIIDRHNYHLFQPLLYQVATAGLSPADIAVPIRSIIGGAKNTEVFLGTVKSINTLNKSVTFDSIELNYDFLIVAVGAKHSYFGKTEWENLAPGLKTLEQATEIRRRVLIAYEKAEIELNPEIKKELLTFVVVGAGPTGVEMAGAIAEISHQTLAKDFKNIDPSIARIILVDAGPRILAAFHPHLSQKATQDLEAMGVQLRINSRVSNITPNSVTIGSEKIVTHTVIWAAGVQPSPLGKELGAPLDSLGRVIVNEFSNIPNNQSVFVVGDLAHFKGHENIPLPGLAPVAIQQGEWAAKNILRGLNGNAYLPFVYRDKGMMATIGRKKAIMQFKGIQVSGIVAWFAWLIIHIFYLIDFKNKLFVFLNWCWSYFTFRKGARLIVDKLDDHTED